MSSRNGNILWLLTLALAVAIPVAVVRDTPIRQKWRGHQAIGILLRDLRAANLRPLLHAGTQPSAATTQPNDVHQGEHP